MTLGVRVAAPFLAGYFVSYVYRMVNAVLAPTLAAEFGLSAGGLGLLSSMYFFAFVFSQLPVGVAMDRWGPRRVNAALLLVAAAGGAWFALAETAPAAMAARAMIGVGVSVALMASLTAFVLWYPADRLSTMNAIAFSVGMLGAMAATVPLELLLRVWPWRRAFLLIVGLTLMVSLVLWLWVPERRVEARAAQPGAGLRKLFTDAAFLRIAVCVGASQCAAVALSTLWIATWLRDVAGYAPAQVARALLLFALSMLVGYIAFGRAADVFVRRGRSTLPLLAGGVATASLSLGLIVLGVRSGALALWGLFFGCATAVVLSYSLFSRRYPREMAGRVNTALNTFVFVGMFSGQWAVGLLLNLWPQTATGYAPEAYDWALGAIWLLQFGGLAWLWSGRRLLGAAPAG